MIVISLGWGVQSFTLAAMSALGELQPVDAAIHADTTHERSDTYRFANEHQEWLTGHGINVVRVQSEKTELFDYGMVVIPAHTLSERGGMLSRQCTYEWKIAPMRRWLQAHRNKQPVEMWLGISLDEVQRMKTSDVNYIAHRFPLIEKRMSRQDCVNWLIRHELDVPPKSSCVFCPFHNRGNWRDLRNSGDGDWSKAVAVDEQIREARAPYQLFLHADKKPLDEIGDSIDLQPELDLTGEECTGSCFL